MLNRANIVLSEGRHRGIDDYMDYLLELLNTLYESVIIGDTYRIDSHNYVLDGNIPNDNNEIKILASAGVVIIFVASEWTKFFKGVLYFNTFQHRDFLTARFLRRLSKKRRGLFTHHIFRKSLREFFDLPIDMLYLLVNRAEEFQRNSSYFTAVIGPCKDLVKPYGDRFKIPAFEIEPFFEENKFLNKNSQIPPKIFFSGKLTKYRQDVLSRIQQIHRTLDIEYVENSTNLSEESFTHELYIPQQFRWPYSSPIRTYRAYRQGFIPINSSQYSQSIMDAYLPTLSESPESYKDFASYTTEKLIEGARASNTIREEQIKNYEVFLIQQQELLKNSTSLKGLREVTVIVEGYRGFNILKLRDRYYGILQVDGAFSLYRIEKKNYSVLFIGEDEASIRRQINGYNPPSERSSQVPLPIRERKKGYQGFNILKLGDRHYGIPQGEGKFNLKRLEQQDYSASFTGDSLASVCSQIEEYNTTQGYQGFKTVRVGKKYYGIPEKEGEFSLDRLKKQEYATLFAANSLPALHRQIAKYNANINQDSQLYVGKNKIQLIIENYVGNLITRLFDS
ncbi:MAG: hypothetical protein J7647_27150 [Cyanobacteria bacterium SBLK]|nr:hypothetical protein [Cyanobacteria bacterium SBLK]